MDITRLRAKGRQLAAYMPPALAPLIYRAYVAAKPSFWRTVNEWRRFIAESESWSVDEIEAYQVQQLRRVVEHAHLNVPYYRSTLQGVGFSPSDLRELSDLRALPVLRKRELQNHQAELLARNRPQRQRVYFTSAGSTGFPVGFYHDSALGAKEWAFMTSQWQRVGYQDGDRTAILRGSVVSAGRLFAPAPFQNALVMSSYHLTEDRLPLYIDALRRYKPRFLRAYPSAATLLAQYMLESNAEPIPTIEAVLCGSENLYDWQRRLIERAFACRVFSWYGQSERVCLAGECERDSHLHIFPQYGFTELLGIDGEPITKSGELGEIVATGFLNESMPLIRYATSDTASYADGSCSTCNRHYARFEGIEGRLQEFIVTGDGRYVSMTAVNMHSPVFDNVFQFRFRQSIPGEVLLQVVPKASYGSSDVERMREELAQKLGTAVKLSVETVQEIPVGARGKFHFLDQSLPSPFEHP
jgi:phenylacetate-CoA ligase